MRPDKTKRAAARVIINVTRGTDGMDGWMGWRQAGIEGRTDETGKQGRATQPPASKAPGRPRLVRMLTKGATIQHHARR